MVLRDGGDIAWAVRKDSPQLLTVLEQLRQKESSGHHAGQYSPLRYLKNAKYVKKCRGE